MKKNFFVLLTPLMMVSLVSAQQVHDGLPEFESQHIKQQAIQNFSKLPELKKWIVENNHAESFSPSGYHVQFRWPMRVNSNYDDKPEYYIVSNYMDINRDVPEGKKDWYCNTYNNALNYDGHEGNDYSLYPFFWRMMNNNNAFACAGAPGIVLVVRDSVDNENNCLKAGENQSANHVSILHSDSSITRYLHIRTGSARVRPGQFVEEGQLLARIGSSGRSSNPHLHFDLQHYRETDGSYDFIEPYDRANDNTVGSGCNPFTSSTWWKNQKTYLIPKMNRVMTHSGTPYLFGYINATYNDQFCPEYEDPKAKNQFAPGELLYVGVALVHVNNEDSVHLSIYYPDGTLWSSAAKPVPDNYDGQSINFRKNLYLTHVASIPANAPQGTYTIRASFTYRPFDANDPYDPATARVTTVANHYFTVGCEADRTLTGFSYGTTGYIVSNSITSTQLVDGGNSIYQSANYIQLNPGFRASAGVTFKAKIRSCNSVE